MHQRFGNDNVDETTDARRVGIKIYPAIILSSTGDLALTFLRCLLDQHSLRATNHTLAYFHRLLIDPGLQDLQALLLDVRG